MNITFEEDLKKSLLVLRNGGIILYPTDTIWGIGCDATNEEAVSQIIALKQRPYEKSFVVLVADEKEVLQHTASPDLALFDYLQKQVRPTTVIYPDALGLANNVIAADGSVAIRICKDFFCKSLIKRLRKPIVSTSANLSGSPSPVNFFMVEEAIVHGVDYAVHHRRDDRTQAQPSSIIKWENGKVTVIR